MAKLIRIITSSFATLENTTPPYNIRKPTCEENLELAISILNAAAGYDPDIVLLPETFKTAGRSSETYFDDAEPINGHTVELLGRKAKEGNYNLAAGLLIRNDNYLSNDALIFNRQGFIVGKYSKNYPVESEIDHGIRPGTDVPVFDLDFGRIGIAICFDLNWKDIWQSFSELKVDLGCWISAYEGGFPLINHAQTWGYPIISSVYPYHARVVDVTGEILASTSRWSRIAFCEVNLDREIYHTDMQMDKIIAIQTKLGKDISIKAYTEEHLFILTNNRSDCTIKDLEKEFSLTSYKDYIWRCTKYRESKVSQR
ncbi:MAG: carbon-nitrogen hydrolase family protein [Flexilinea sp.]